jgi:16S rRNA (cytidine1402-2'-O)-methyltransferase
MGEAARGTLYVVATPIGNLEDATPRAVRLLGEVDWIACEDTRHTRKLLAHFGIRRPEVISCFAGNEARRAQGLAARLARGETGALVTDAGTPGISDPGARVVRAAIEAGARVIPLPGPSALTAALSASAFAPIRFRFLGFLPSRAGARAEALDEAIASRDPVVLFESPRRAAGTLEALAARAPDRSCVVFREITKVFEDARRGTLAEVSEAVSGAGSPGEFVIVLGPAAEIAAGEVDVAAAMAERIERGESPSDAAREVARRLRVPRAQAYRAGLALRGRRGGRDG